MKNNPVKRALLLFEYHNTSPYYFRYIASSPVYLLSNLDKELIALLNAENLIPLPSVYTLLIEFLINDT